MKVDNWVFFPHLAINAELSLELVNLQLVQSLHYSKYRSNSLHKILVYC